MSDLNINYSEQDHTILTGNLSPDPNVSASTPTKLPVIPDQLTVTETVNTDAGHVQTTPKLPLEPKEGQENLPLASHQDIAQASSQLASQSFIQSLGNSNPSYRAFLVLTKGVMVDLQHEFYIQDQTEVPIKKPLNEQMDAYFEASNQLFLINPQFAGMVGTLGLLNAIKQMMDAKGQHRIDLDKFPFLKETLKEYGIHLPWNGRISEHRLERIISDLTKLTGKEALLLGIAGLPLQGIMARAMLSIAPAIVAKQELLELYSLQQKLKGMSTKQARRFLRKHPEIVALLKGMGIVSPHANVLGFGTSEMQMMLKGMEKTISAGLATVTLATQTAVFSKLFFPHPAQDLLEAAAFNLLGDTLIKGLMSEILGDLSASGGKKKLHRDFVNGALTMLVLQMALNPSGQGLQLQAASKLLMNKSTAEKLIESLTGKPVRVKVDEEDAETIRTLRKALHKLNDQLLIGSDFSKSLAKTSSELSQAFGLAVLPQNLVLDSLPI